MTNAADAITKAINKPTPGQPRQIRAQVGLTEDPLPEGKTVAKPEHHQKIEPASHGSNDPGNDSNTELSKEGIKGHKEELKNMQNQAAKYDTSATGPLDKNGPAQSMTDMKTQRKQ
ncbi:hypothetical protein ABBQ32_010466 [Trebouxia sp. C0010 RCD-2024]